MACSADGRVALALLAAVTLPGCVTGHLLDAARLRERPLVIEAAALDGDSVTLHYTAEVTDDAGVSRGTVRGAAAVPVATLRAPTSPAADALAPAWRSPAAPGERGLMVVRGAGVPSDAGSGPFLEVVQQDGRDTAIVWRDGPDAEPWAPVPAAAFTRQRTALWVWPLVPPALALDAVLTPVLLAFAPAVMVIGE